MCKDSLLVADQTQTTSLTKERVDTVQGSAPRGRFVRVVILGVAGGRTPAIAEMEMSGSM
jgi:hypothetical protein